MMACFSGLVRAREGPLLPLPGHVSTGLSNLSIYFSIRNAPLLQLGYIDIYIYLLFHILTNIWMYQLLAKNGGIVTRRWNANARAQPRSGSWLARWGQRGRSRGSSRGCRKRFSSSPGQQVKSEPCMQLLAAVACWHIFGSSCDANGNQAV